MRFSKDQESDKDKSLKNHDGKDISDMVFIIEPWYKLTFIKLMAYSWCRLFIIVLQMTAEIENNEEIHAKNCSHECYSEYG